MLENLDDENQTLVFGAKLAKALPQKALVFLDGPLGAGKTTLVRGLLRELGHQGSTKSPTYTLVEPYELTDRRIYHFDLYRVNDPEELEYMGIRDYLEEQAVCLIEWPDKGKFVLPEPDLIIRLTYHGESRKVLVESQKPFWQSWMSRLSG